MAGVGLFLNPKVPEPSEKMIFSCLSYVTAALPAGEK